MALTNGPVETPGPPEPYHSSPADLGIFKSTLFPSFALHSGISVAAYLAGRAADRVEFKDYCWPSSQVANAWWSAVGTRMYHDNISFSQAWDTIPWTEKILLSCVTVWGTRLFYRVISRSLTSGKGRDDKRYEEEKSKEPGGPQVFWNKAFLRLFLSEGVFLTFITLPFTLPFREPGPPTLHLGNCCVRLARAAGVGLFTAGFAMEALADAQLESHRKKSEDLCRYGVWSIVRHPKYVLPASFNSYIQSCPAYSQVTNSYLGDALVHGSFILLNIANNFHPLCILGPLANYADLRLFGGDKQNEQSQEERYKAQSKEKYEQLNDWRNQKNSFWPNLKEIVNPWSWALVGVGIAGAFVVEEILGP